MKKQNFTTTISVELPGYTRPIVPSFYEQRTRAPVS
jgi:hypothetical protein